MTRRDTGMYSHNWRCLYTNQVIYVLAKFFEFILFHFSNIVACPKDIGRLLSNSITGLTDDKWCDAYTVRMNYPIGKNYKFIWLHHVSRNAASVFLKQSVFHILKNGWNNMNSDALMTLHNTTVFMTWFALIWKLDLYVHSLWDAHDISWAVQTKPQPYYTLICYIRL